MKNISWFVHLQETWLGKNISCYVHLQEKLLGENIFWFVHLQETWLGNNVSWFLHLQDIGGTQCFLIRKLKNYPTLTTNGQFMALIFS